MERKPIPEGFQEYIMTEEEYEEILLLTAGNDYGLVENSILITFWKKLADKYNFEWHTGEESPNGGKYFLAVPRKE
ncbi:hypothetical protein [Flexithrix dorotheae]|uniref:hypothetical protein n=1 Tax=Flexithrix dorotheae TaxID=70993 RepID=UPI000380EB8F|nr:hypothetical protein [Flexithrix dorotheae]